MAGVVVGHVGDAAALAQQPEVERAEALCPGGVAVAVCKHLVVRLGEFFPICLAIFLPIYLPSYACLSVTVKYERLIF